MTSTSTPETGTLVGDPTKGHWHADGRPVVARWSWHGGSKSLLNLHLAPEGQKINANAALTAMIERDNARGAAGTEPSTDQPEPVKPMFGWEIGDALDAGQQVERLTADGWEPWDPEGRDRKALGTIDRSAFVARVVSPPGPETERVPLHRLRGRTLPNGSEVHGFRQQPRDGAWEGFTGHAIVPLEVDADGMVEVLAAGSDTPEQEKP